MDPRIALWMPRLRRAALVAALLLLAFGVIGTFAIPQVARWGVESMAARELGRGVHVERITANPFALSVTLHNLTVDGAAGETVPLMTVREIYANGSIASLFRLAPVLDALKIDGLTANLVRLDEQHFNFSDVVDRIRAKPKTSDEPARFSLSNIEVTDSTIRLDDRPNGKQHALTELALGVPFVSSLSSHAEITVQPAFSAQLNGAPIVAKGETRPFKQSLESSLDLKLDGVDIPTYLPYAPLQLNFTVPRGTLATDLRVAFRRAAPAQGDLPAVAAQTLLSGSFVTSDFELAAPAARPQPLIGWKSLRVTLDEFDPFARRLVIADAVLSAPALELARDGAGTINWLRFKDAPLLSAAAAATTSGAAPFVFTLKRGTASGGTITLTDDSAAHFRIQMLNFNGEAANLTTAAPTRGTVRGSGDIADDGGSVSAEGELGLAPVAGALKLAGRNVRMRAPARYLAQIVDATVDGSSDVDAVFEFSMPAPQVLLLRDIHWRGKDLKVRGPAGSGAEFDLDGLTLDGATLDLAQRQFTADQLALDGPRATVRRLADGRINWLAAFRTPPGGKPPAARTAPVEAANSSWKVALKEVAIARGDLRLEDAVVEPAVKLRATEIAGRVRNLVSDGTQRAEFDLRTRFGRTGSLAAVGGATWNPLVADARVDARNLDVAVLRPYIAERLNATLARAEISGRGTLTAARPQAEAPLALSYKGNARVGNLHVLDAQGESDLLKWQVLDLEQIAFAAGKEAPTISVGTATLSDFYARVIVSEQGRLNLVDLVRRDGDATPVTARPPAGPARRPATKAAAAHADTAEPLVDREMAGNATAEPAGTREAADPAPVASALPRARIRIGQIELVRGNVNFTDNFIKPNYTANITGLGGTVTTLATDSTEPATMTLAGMIDNEAPVDISGRLNPLAPVLFLDIEGRTKGVDLPRLTPYAVKYAGYPIVKGKLSMEVKYKVEDGKLAANNHLFLDQLTFGEKVESPTATKLPVLLAVRLLTNSRGEIDINLPISGTLADPKFSVGAIIVQVIVNLLTKAVTAPFTLLASAFGGGAELGRVEFAPGSAALTAEQTQRVDTLAKALNDRTGLKLDIIGRVDPALDTEGAKRAKLDGKLRAAKVRQTVRASGEAVDPATVVITPEERPALLATVYGNESIPDKPRNAIGIAKSIPPAEMETLILANLAVTPEDLRALANQRASTVRNRLEIEGKVSRDRLFLVEPKLTAEGIQDKGATTRVDFSLK